MRDLLSIGTSRGCEMIGTGIGLGVSGFRLNNIANVTPEQVSGLKVWLDASDYLTTFQSSGGSLASADGDPVGQWQDKSGNGNHIGQIDGTKKPILKTSLTNGKNGIRFDGVNDKLQSVFTLNQPTMVMAVANVKSGNAQLWDGGSQDKLWGYVTSSPYKFQSYAGNYGPEISPFSLNQMCLIEMLYNAASSEIFLNGTSYGVGNVGSSNAGGFTIGGSAGNYTNIQADVFEVLIYSTSLTTSNRVSLERYLRVKWGF